MKARLLFIALAAFSAGSALGADPAPATDGTAKSGVFCDTQHTKDCQAAVTPQQVLERFKKGNERFASGHGTHRNYAQQVKATAAGQYPLASVVSCIDSRAPAEILFDQGIGDLFNARVAGNIVNEDILGSLELAKIMPAVNSIPNDGSDRTSKNYAFVEKVADRNVRLTVQRIRDQSPILKDLEDKGEILIVGAMYDVKSGKVTWYD
jgi:carbonic anhydrase